MITSPLATLALASGSRSRLLLLLSHLLSPLDVAVVPPELAVTSCALRTTVSGRGDTVFQSVQPNPTHGLLHMPPSRYLDLMHAAHRCPARPPRCAALPSTLSLAIFQLLGFLFAEGFLAVRARSPYSRRAPACPRAIDYYVPHTGVTPFARADCILHSSYRDMIISCGSPCFHLARSIFPS